MTDLTPKPLITLPADCYGRISEYLINPRSTTSFFHKFFNIFKNTHKDFLRIVINHFLRLLQVLYDIDVDDEMNDIIKTKILARIINKKSLTGDIILQDFMDNKKIINYKSVKNILQREKIYYLAIFNGYIWNSNKLYSGFKVIDVGICRFLNKLESLEKTEPFKEHGAYKLSDLVKLKIYDMNCFELYIRNTKKKNSLYKLKNDIWISEPDGFMFCSKNFKLVKII